MAASEATKDVLSYRRLKAELESHVKDGEVINPPEAPPTKAQYCVRQHSRLGDAEERACIACLASLKRALRAFAKRVILATEYRDCVLDVAVPIAALDAALNAANRPSGKPSAEAALLAGLWLVECNTPVYLLATSGCFDLSNEADREILCGDAVDAEVVLPVLLAEFEWRTWRIELRQ